MPHYLICQPLFCTIISYRERTFNVNIIHFIPVACDFKTKRRMPHIPRYPSLFSSYLLLVSEPRIRVFHHVDGSSAFEAQLFQQVLHHGVVAVGVHTHVAALAECPVQTKRPCPLHAAIGSKAVHYAIRALPLTISVAMLEVATAAPHPNVLNFASVMIPSSIFR